MPESMKFRVHSSEHAKLIIQLLKEQGYEPVRDTEAYLEARFMYAYCGSIYLGNDAGVFNRARHYQEMAIKYTYTLEPVKKEP